MSKNYKELVKKVNQKYKGDKTVPYMGNNSLPDARSVYDYDKDRVDVIRRCHKDIIFFAENFFYIITSGRKENIKLREYQIEGLKLFQDYKKTIFNTSRQVGKTTLMTIYAVWLITFFEYRKVMIVANKSDTAKEILERIKIAYEEMPNWIKPETKGWNKLSVEFKNGSSIKIAATSSDAARGSSLNCLIIDEVAHIDDNMLDAFWSSVSPTISNDPNGRILMASTPKGVGNLFHRIWNESQQPDSPWGYLKVMWDDIGGRSETFKQEQIIDLGSEELFRQEYCCEFLESSGSYIHEELYNELAAKCIEPRIELANIDGYKIFREPDLENRIYVAGVDVGEGVNECNSVVQILDVTNLTSIEQVAIYVTNKVGPNGFAKNINDIMKHWGKPPIAVERNNSGGGVVVTLLAESYGYPCIVNFAEKQGRLDYGHLRGVTASTNTKYLAVMNMFDFLKTKKVITLRELETLKELNTFVRHKNERWSKKSSAYKDDRVDALYWALICIHERVVTQYFSVEVWDDEKKPLVIKPLYDIYGKNYRLRFGDKSNNYGADPFIFSGDENIDPFMQEMNDIGWLTPEQDARRGWSSYEPAGYLKH